MDPRLCSGRGGSGITDIDVLQAVTFYRTPLRYNENSTNRRL